MILCSWEGNRRPGITLAMRHRLSGITTYRLNGLEKSIWALRLHFPVEYGNLPLLGTLYGCSINAALWLYVIPDNEERSKKISIAIKPVVPNRRDYADNITDIRNVVQGFRLSPTIQVSTCLMCRLLMITFVCVNLYDQYLVRNVSPDVC